MKQRHFFMILSIMHTIDIFGFYSFFDSLFSAVKEGRLMIYGKLRYILWWVAFLQYRAMPLWMFISFLQRLPIVINLSKSTTGISHHLIRFSASRIQFLLAVLCRSSIHLACGCPTLGLQRCLHS